MPVVIGGDNLPYPVRIGLTDLLNIGVGGGASGPPGPPGSGTTVPKLAHFKGLYLFFLSNFPEAKFI